MKAELLFQKRLNLTETDFVEMVVWRVPQPVKNSPHDFKYRLVLISDDVCVLRYDNEAGKGDHKHQGDLEMPYRFAGPDQLQEDFWIDVEAWRNQR